MHLKDGKLVVELVPPGHLGKDAGGGGEAMSMRAKNIVAGSCGGLTMISIFHPLDTIKTRVQTQASVFASAMYSGPVDCFRKTVEAEGVRGLYKGLTSPLAGIVFYNAASFTAYDEIKLALSARAPEGGVAPPLETHHYFAAGALTGLAVTCCEHPFDLVKCKLQLEGMRRVAAGKVGASLLGAPSSTLDVVRRIASHGVRGWTQGASAAVARNVSNCFWFFGLYELLKNEAAVRRPDCTYSNRVLTGSVANVCCTLLSFPIDVIHYTLMAEPSDPAHRRYTGVVDCAKGTFARGGVRAFVAGLSPALARSALGGAVLVSVVEAVRARLSIPEDDVSSNHDRESREESASALGAPLREEGTGAPSGGRWVVFAFNFLTSPGSPHGEGREEGAGGEDVAAASKEEEKEEGGQAGGGGSPGGAYEEHRKVKRLTSERGEAREATVSHSSSSDLE
ncbi:mitochondrial carrier domain-containing protein [Baffinella frigidus]|nr:mitochondrial carrier domain-containing protein [Cryptophyta sp. CCMP2293]